MEGHEDTRRPFAPTAGEEPGSPPPDQLDEHAQRLTHLEIQLGALAAAVGGLAVAAETVAPETRLDSLERRIEAFGLGGETVGDALQLAAFALANARAVADAVSRITGSTVPLPPAPEFKGRLEEPRVKGAELAEIM